MKFLAYRSVEAEAGKPPHRDITEIPRQIRLGDFYEVPSTLRF